MFQNRLSDAFVMRVSQQRQLQIVPLPFKELFFSAHYGMGVTSRRWRGKVTAG